jgi:uncharacterized zinc-type alcohol dehydrogenase-like protein
MSRTTIRRRSVGPYDALVEIRYCGVCHSDIHTVRGEWGPVEYPLVPGHEITGVIVAVGEGVTRFRDGDRVGVGVMIDSCRKCENCVAGEEQYCDAGWIGTYGAVDRYGQVTQGGYASHIVVDENYVLRIPDTLDLAVAAPLLCAGITTYSPLAHWKVGKGARVAVIGLGGLGHMAVQIAAAMGAEVTVLSRSVAKLEDAKRLGAKHAFVATEERLKKMLRCSFDVIVSTVSTSIDLDAHLDLLRRNGTFIQLGLPQEALTVKAFSVTANRRRLAGSDFGGIAETQRMLDFCAEHRALPIIEIVAAEQLEDAYARIVSSDVRYRFVLDCGTLGGSAHAVLCGD